MKFKEYLQEEYIGSFKAKKGASLSFSGGQTEIFKNPSNKELRSIANQEEENTIRFFVDFDNNCIYTWKASTVHWSVQKQLEKENIHLRNWYQGVAKFQDGKLHEIDIDSIYWDMSILFNNGQEDEREPNEKEQKKIDKWIV